MRNLKQADSFFLTGSEFALLLLLGDIIQIYGFRIPEMSALDSESATKAFFSLWKKGFIEITASDDHIGSLMDNMDAEGFPGCSVCLCSNLKQYLLRIKTAEQIIHVKRSMPIPGDICVYDSRDGCCCVEMLESESSLIRVSGFESTAQCIASKGFCLEEVVSDELLYQEEAIPEDVLAQELSIGKEWKREEAWEQIAIVNAKTGDILAELFLYKRPVNDLLLISIPMQDDRFFYYSQKKLMELIQSV